MHRFHLPPDRCLGPTMTLAGREAHHGLHVLRLRRGARVVVLDGAGGEFDCEVSELMRNTMELAVKEKKLVPPLSYQITLLQAIPKGKLFESIVQKATELGVFRIVPLLTERVVTRLDEEGSASKTAHWRTIALEAIKQCGSAWLPQIDDPTTVDDFLSRRKMFDLSLVASLQPGSRHPREWFRAFHAQHQRGPRSACVWVGPEGDFTEAEVAGVRSGGANPISLGSLVLRCDTAAVYCLSVMNYEFQSPSV